MDKVVSGGDEAIIPPFPTVLKRRGGAMVK
jgi:hypothetical protein